MAVTFDAPSYGHVAEKIADLELGIRNVILSPKGSVPLNPEKGCNLYPYIDRPPSEGIPNMTREIWDALKAWCPRILVDRVEVEQVAFHHYKVPVFWRPIESINDELIQTVINYQPEAAV